MPGITMSDNSFIDKNGLYLLTIYLFFYIVGQAAQIQGYKNTEIDTI